MSLQNVSDKPDWYSMELTSALGARKTIEEWSDLVDLPPVMIYERIMGGKTTEQALGRKGWEGILREPPHGPPRPPKPSERIRHSEKLGSHTTLELSRMTGIPVAKITARVEELGWTVDEALNLVPRLRRRRPRKPHMQWD